MQKRTRQYEVMFLISQSAAADFNALIGHLNEIFGRSHAEIIAMKKWDERRLAFEMDKQKRGVYILCYIRCDTRSIASMERDCNLSEKIMRTMILEVEHLTEEEMKSADARDELAPPRRPRARAQASPWARPRRPSPRRPRWRRSKSPPRPPPTRKSNRARPPRAGAVVAAATGGGVPPTHPGFAGLVGANGQKLLIAPALRSTCTLGFRSVHSFFASGAPYAQSQQSHAHGQPDP